MHYYNNLLYISHNTNNDVEGLKQALSTANNNNASLKILIICPIFPEDIANYQEKYEAFLLFQMQNSLERAQELIHPQTQHTITITTEILKAKKPVVDIVRYVLKHHYDLVIKQAQAELEEIDIELLRKCPTTIWLSKAIRHSHNQMKIAVAIDPDDQQPQTIALSKKLLQLSNFLAGNCNGHLHIISCWSDLSEIYLRDHVRFNIPHKEIDTMILKKQNAHLTALKLLINESNMTESYHIYHLKGEAKELIPIFTKDHKIDILVMGTIARGGIPGFIIGNTAEKIMLNLPCSLIALKPEDYISPIKLA
ncbi:universal stress protein [Thiotrichales bacterium 19S3-7]|nr:universal stress protein [Thiotrichales bacterium 19S3-7]MCF6802042.1 universal stress protein [Thiotrichales bacterium 19S3-11]